MKKMNVKNVKTQDEMVSLCLHRIAFFLIFTREKKKNDVDNVSRRWGSAPKESENHRKSNAMNKIHTRNKKNTQRQRQQQQQRNEWIICKSYMSKNELKILQITWRWESGRGHECAIAFNSARKWCAHVYLMECVYKFKHTFFWTLFPLKPVSMPRI